MPGLRKSREGHSHVGGCARGMVTRGWLRNAFLFLTIVLICAAIGRCASGMFVARPEGREMPSSAAQEPEREDPNANLSPESTSTEDIKLQEQVTDITPVPAQGRKVNSNVFARMSGQPQRMWRRVIPPSTTKTASVRLAVLTEAAGFQEKMLAVGSGVFIMACFGATGIAFLRIKKLSSPN